MSAYNPPIEDIPTFNSSLFNQPEQTLSQAEADLLYLSKTKTDTSTAPQTTFNGQMWVKGDTDVGIAGSSGWFNVRYRSRFFDISFPNSNYTQLYMIGNNEFVIGPNSIGDKVSVYIKEPSVGAQIQRLEISHATTKITNNLDVSGNITGSSLIQSNTTSISTNAIYNNLFTGSTLTIGTANSSNTINGFSTFNNGLLGNLNANSIDGNGNTGTKTLFTALTGTLNIGQATTTLVNVKAPTTIDLLLTLANRLNFNVASYSFPFASNQSLGYYLKTTGTGTSVTSATPKSILTTATIPVGVWRLDFSVQNVVGASGAGTITQSQSYISTTLDGNIGTAVAFTGSIIRSHVSEVYGNNDVQVINSSITYNQSTAGVLYLNIVRTFATGTYSFTGEIAITRLA